MEMYTDAQIIAKLQEKNKPLFILNDFARLFKIKNRNTLYKIIQRLEKRKVITQLKNGSYRLSPGLINPPLSDFRLANFLYHPSYISLETALSLYGIITGFSYVITSVSIKKTASISIEGKEFSYSSISPKLFWGYEKTADYLIADPEKSLLDYLYFAYKGLRSIQLDEFDFSIIKKNKFKKYLSDTQNNNLINFTKKITAGVNL
ncbi:hypothetical protein KJ707_03840 [Patescibacteria group bacterium]|nr:hypothetical protein [Patescibacteria group bacterium]MBU1966916.1 hypothetical protein [Patescibacteria group bacterium]MBU2543662.1 hypothetical protein [Patescibacteria group bacterium]